MNGRTSWIIRGALGVTGLPALVLMSAMVGFGGLAREAGLTLGEATFATFFIWALPSMIVLVGGIVAGLSLPATALAVALASMRFTPMVMAIVPEMRSSSTRRRTLLGLSHFVAITAWVHAIRAFPNVPREHRAAFFGGFAITLTVLSTVIVGTVHQIAPSLPREAAIALVFLTPIYFLTTLWASAKLPSDRPALLLGLGLGPLIDWVSPSLGLLGAGIIGGTLAFVFARRRNGTS